MTRILVAHESETIREVIRRLLDEAGWSVDAVGEGRAALAALAARPDGLVIDVALPDVHAFEVIEEARRQTPPVRVVLVASVYNRTGYKRRPTSLYGADDYVEQHHIPDALVEKLEKLVGPPPRRAPHVPADADTAEGRSIRAAGEGRLDPLEEPDPLVVQRAERLAWLIISDIALYNGAALDGAHLDDPEELQARLRVDLEEGRLLFEMRVPAGVRRTRDFIGEALERLRAERRKAP